MGIGMVMTTDHLIPIAQHGPTSLEVQGHLRTLKAHCFEISPHLIHNLLRQRREIWVLMQLPRAMEIASPGTSICGISGRIPSQGKQHLKLPCHIQRIQGQLHRCDGSGKELMKLHCHHPIKKAGPRRNRPSTQSKGTINHRQQRNHPPLPEFLE
jgi:hypothetical protein